MIIPFVQLIQCVNAGELSGNEIGRSGYQFKTEKVKLIVTYSCCPQNLEFGHLKLLFCKGWQRNVSKCITCVQIDLFLFIKLIVLWKFFVATPLSFLEFLPKRSRCRIDPVLS